MVRIIVLFCKCVFTSAGCLLLICFIGTPVTIRLQLDTHEFSSHSADLWMVDVRCVVRVSLHFDIYLSA